MLKYQCNLGSCLVGMFYYFARVYVQNSHTSDLNTYYEFYETIFWGLRYCIWVIKYIPPAVEYQEPTVVT